MKSYASEDDGLCVIPAGFLECSCADNVHIFWMQLQLDSVSLSLEHRFSDSPVPPTLCLLSLWMCGKAQANAITQAHSWRGYDMFVQLAQQQRIITLTQQCRSWLKDDVRWYAEHNVWDRCISCCLSRLAPSYPRCPLRSPFHVCFVHSLFCSFFPFVVPFSRIRVYNNTAHLCGETLAVWHSQCLWVKALTMV